MTSIARSWNTPWKCRASRPSSSSTTESEWEGGAMLTEAEEAELAQELLGVANEEELDQFLGNLDQEGGARAPAS